MNIDIERLRSDLIDYFGTGAQLFGGMYYIVDTLRRASDEKVIEIAINEGFNLSDYKIKEYIL